MLKNFVKTALITSLFLNPLVSSAQSRNTDSKRQISASEEFNSRRANLRTEQGKQRVFRYFTLLSKQDQLEYLNASERSQIEVERAIEELELKLEVIKESHNSDLKQVVIYTPIAIIGGSIVFGFGSESLHLNSRDRVFEIQRKTGINVLSEHDEIPKNWKEIINANRSKYPALMNELEPNLMRVKFGTGVLTAGVLFGVMLVAYSGGYLGYKIYIKNPVDAGKALDAIKELKKDIENESQMLVLMRQYAESNP